MEYHLSAAGRELRPIVTSIGVWGQRWVESHLSLKNLDPSLLMWDIRRNLHPGPLPPGRCTIQFQYPELPVAQKNWWLVIEDGKVDLCGIDPGYEVNLMVRGSLRTMTAIWMGFAGIPAELAAGRLELEGERRIAQAIERWLGRSTFARDPQEAS